MKAIERPPSGKQQAVALLKRETTTIAPDQVWSRLNPIQREAVKQALVEVCRRLPTPGEQEDSHEHK